MIANNDSGAAGLQDDLLSKYRQLPADEEVHEDAVEVLEHAQRRGGGVERVGAKRRRTNGAEASRGTGAGGRRDAATTTTKSNEDNDEDGNRATSEGPATCARDGTQGAVAGDEDDDEEVTAVFNAGAGANAARDAAGTTSTGAGVGPLPGQRPANMTASQIKRVQARTYNLLMSFWARRGDHARGEPGEEL